MRNITNIILIAALMAPYPALAVIPSNQKAKVIRTYLNGDRDLTPTEKAELDMNGDRIIDETDYQMASGGQPVAQSGVTYTDQADTPVPVAQGGENNDWLLYVILTQSHVTTSNSTPAGTPPSTPAGFAGIAGNADVTLNWAAPAVGTTNNLYQSTIQGVLGTKIAGVPNPPFTLTGLTNGTTYYFALSAQTAAGESAPSAAIALTPTMATASGSITAIAPATTWTVGQNINVTGTGLTGATAATVNGIAATIQSTTATTAVIVIPPGASKLTGVSVTLTIGGVVVSSSLPAQNIAPAVLLNWSTGWNGVTELDANTTALVGATSSGNILQAQMSNGLASSIDNITAIVSSGQTVTLYDKMNVYYTMGSFGSSTFSCGGTQPNGSTPWGYYGYSATVMPISKAVIAYFSSTGIVKTVMINYGMLVSVPNWGPFGPGACTTPSGGQWSSYAGTNTQTDLNMTLDETNTILDNPNRGISPTNWVSVLYNPIGSVWYYLDTAAITKVDRSVNPAVSTTLPAPPAGGKKLYFDNAGNLVILTGTGIQKLIGGTTWTPFSNFVTTSFQAQADGTAYVLDTATKAVRLLDVNGNVAGAVIYTSANGIPPDMKLMAGNLYVLETNGTITKITF
jgi:hypothetical protein